MGKKRSKNKSPWSAKNLVEDDQNLIRPEKAHNEFAQKIWAQSHQQLVCNCMETNQSEAKGMWPKVHRARRSL